MLEAAIQLAASGNAQQTRVRFAFWSGEEGGLVGSDQPAVQGSQPAEVAE
ncbi:MAG: M28 family peptidase [Microbacteriaceae bacterium]